MSGKESPVTEEGRWRISLRSEGAESSPGTATRDTAESGRQAEDSLSEAGRLLWVPRDGSPREVSPSELGSGAPPAAATGARPCRQCGATRSIETVVREHPECGYVGVDGFVDWGTGSRLSCPKCDAEADTPEPFIVVATAHSCVRCGTIVDQPLGRNGDEP